MIQASSIHKMFDNYLIFKGEIRVLISLSYFPFYQITLKYICSTKTETKQSTLFRKKKEMENNNLSMVVLPEVAWKSITSEIASLKSILQKKSEEEVNGQWVESSEARRLLGVSQKTWQTYRDSRKIPFSQFGRKIYVKRADLESFLQNHYVSSK